MTINKNIIKEKLKKNIGDYNWQELIIKEFDYKNAKIKMKNKIITLNGKLNWRVYQDFSKTEPVFVIDNNENILYMSEEKPQLPTSLFDFNLYYKNEYSTYFAIINLKDEYVEYLEEVFDTEEIREYYICGLVEFFREKNIKVLNEDEGIFSFLKMKQGKYYKIKESEENQQTIFKMLCEIGLTTNKELF